MTERVQKQDSRSNKSWESSPAKQEKTLWTKCRACEQIIYNKELEENFKVCPKCGHYMRLSALERIALLTEQKTFKALDEKLSPANPLEFPGYTEKLGEARKKSLMKEAAISGEGLIGPHRCVICVIDFEYMGGSMGSVVGEKIARAAERAVSKKLPLIMVSASGGARMQEGILSLMQMAKTSGAVARIHEQCLPYISIMTNPTSGGVTASFAMLGDVNIAEPNALIAFTGPRVIEQTIREKLPDGFQLSEFLLSHGMLDLIVERKNLKMVVIKLLSFFKK